MLKRNKPFSNEKSPVLYLVGTPIGNLKDISQRAVEVLKSVDLIASEDTRNTSFLLKNLGIENKKLVSCYSQKEKEEGKKIINAMLTEGVSVAFVSDAGNPGISDPGAILCSMAIEENIPVTAVLGPSAFVQALITSGFDTSDFSFYGFLPVKENVRKDFLKNLIIVSAEVDKIKWKELEKALKNKNVFYTKWDKIWSGQQVSEKLKEYSATMLSFLNVTKKYKEYSFKEVEEYSTEENSSKQDVEKTTTNFEEKTDKFNETVFPKPRVKMECMPEIKEFEETLASVDKTQPVEERVRYVLGAMGLNNMSVKEQKQIVEIASTAVKKGRMAFDIIFVEANIPIEQTMTVRMTFSKFVNDFVQKYESGKKVKLLTFLSELQKIIMFESEIESFSDFTD